MMAIMTTETSVSGTDSTIMLIKVTTSVNKSEIRFGKLWEIS